MMTKHKTTAIYDSTNSHWSEHPDFNQIYLRSQQNYWNDMLVARGHVFLNEILQELGLPLFRDGQIVGWKKGSKIEFNPEYKKDRILLHFEVDGDILDTLN